MDVHPLQILKLEQQRSPSLKWVTINENVSRLLDPIMDMPVSVISIIGPPSKGKSILFANIASYLASLEGQEESWSHHPIKQTKWPGGKLAFKAPSVWSYHRHFVIPNDFRSKREDMAVLLFYTHSFDDSNWEKENHDICALLGLTMAISTSTIVNVYKHLNEECISALSVYLKYAVEGAKSKSSDLQKLTDTPIQNMTLVIRDWNFPIEEDFHGRTGGHNSVKRKLEQKQGQSRSSRQSRQLIKGLVRNVSGWLLPFPGNDFIEQPYTNDVINEGSSRFDDCLKSFVLQAVRTQMLETKTDVYGNVVNGRILRDMISRYLEGVNTMRAKVLKPATIFRLMGKQYVVDSDEQEDCIPTALRTYSEVWRAKRRNSPFFDERTLNQTHEIAFNKAVNAFKHEVNQVDEDDEYERGYMDVKISNHIYGILTQKLEGCYHTIKEENFKRKLGAMNDMKHETVQGYRNKIKSLYRADTFGLDEAYVVAHSGEMLRKYIEGFQRTFTSQLGTLDTEEAEIIRNLQTLLENEQKEVLEKLFPDSGSQY